MRRALRHAVLASGPLLAVLAAPASAQQDAALEYRVKAAYLVNFARYVDWPPGAIPAAGPIRICVLGKSPFGAALHEAAVGRTVGGREVAIAEARSVREADGCAIVFVPLAEWRRNAVRADDLQSLRALVVGEGRDFARQAGTIGFVIADETVRFVVNLEARDRAGLRIGSRILALATDLYGHRTGAP